MMPFSGLAHNAQAAQTVDRVTPHVDGVAWFLRATA